MSGRPRLRALPGGLAATPREPVAVDARGVARTGLAPTPRDSLAVHARGFARTALAAAGAWLLEPAEPRREPQAAPAGPLRPVIAVFGLARGCGVTVVARALAAELATRDADGAAAVHCNARAAGIPLATQAAAQLARTLRDVPGADTRAVGRLCLVGGAERTALVDSARHFAPLVLDAGSAALGGVPAALADRVVVVATPSVEPALAGVAAACLDRLGHEAILVLNRAEPAPPDRGPLAAGEGSSAEDDRSERWRERRAHRLPESRMGAQLALGGREARGELGRAVAELADLCEGRR
jgi:hypothetical protein